MSKTMSNNIGNKMKRIQWLAIIGLCAVSSGATRAQSEPPAAPFRDVPMDHWAYQAVENLRQRGILRGYPDQSYRGKRTVTRYEAAEALERVRLAMQASPRETPLGEMGKRGPQGPKGDRGPQGEAGPKGVPPPEAELYLQALKEMRKELAAIREQLDTANRKAGNLTDQTKTLKSSARPIRTGK